MKTPNVDVWRALGLAVAFFLLLPLPGAVIRHFFGEGVADEVGNILGAPGVFVAMIAGYGRDDLGATLCAIAGDVVAYTIVIFLVFSTIRACRRSH